MVTIQPNSVNPFGCGLHYDESIFFQIRLAVHTWSQSFFDFKVVNECFQSPRELPHNNPECITDSLDLNLVHKRHVPIERVKSKTPRFPHAFPEKSFSVLSVQFGYFDPMLELTIVRPV